MDIATLLGIVGAVGCLILGFTMDGGTIGALVQVSAMILVFGGTLGATLVTVPMKQFLGIVKYLRKAFSQKKEDPLATIETIVQLANTARREGILALEDAIEKIDNRFLKTGLQFAVDGIDPELVRELLETELYYIEDRHHQGAKMFEAAGGFAPTMGIIGTVMGLVHVLGNLSDVSKLGPEIATAFTATLYGVSSANVFWLPIAYKLKHKHTEEMLLREIEVEGILSIQAGENPRTIEQKLKAFLAPSARERKAKTGDVNATPAEQA